MSKNRKRMSRKSGNNDYWQSYSDMMAGLLLMFILIMALTLVQSLHTYEQKNADLDRQQATINEQQKILDAQQEELKKQQNNLEQVTGELAELTKLVGVKSEIIESLKLEFSDSNLAVKVDEQTGAITFDAGILFSFGSSSLSSAGKTFLQDFLPQYISVLLSDDYIDNVAEIIIEGHTDNNGTYIYNLELSQERAHSVARYCLEKDQSVLNESQILILQEILTANGRSFSDPIYNSNGDVDSQASRRVVFKFRLKDEEMINAIQDLLGDSHD